MADSTAVKASIGFKGTIKGRPGAPKLAVNVGRTLRCDFTGTGKVLYDAATAGAELTVAAGATRVFDLQSLITPLIETKAMTQAYALGFIHSGTSLATGGGGIRVFDQTSLNLFLGPINSGGKLTLLPGEGFEFVVQADKVGKTVDATHKNIDLINLDGANAATVLVYLIGKE